MDRCFCYLDLLGFSGYVEDDRTEFAAALMDNYNAMLDFWLTEEKIHPSAKNRTPSAVFSDFLPFSDSLFITSDDPNAFIEQLADLLCSAFEFTANAYLSPKDEKHPEDVVYKTLRGDEIRKDYPFLARGAVSYGEVQRTKCRGLFRSQPFDAYNLVGKAVIEAVDAAESRGKGLGPYLFVTDGFYERLNGHNKSLVRTFNGHKYYLWPTKFITMTDPYLASINEIPRVLRMAANWCRAFAARGKETLLPYYRDFLTLCIRSFLAVFPEDEDAIRRILQEHRFRLLPLSDDERFAEQML